MTFPVVASSALSFQGAVTTHTVTMPSGVQVGDLLFLVIQQDGNVTLGGTITTTWTQKTLQTIGSGRGAVYEKIADGTEGASVTYTSSGADEAVQICLRITGHDPATPVALSAVAASSSTAPNPNSLSPSWGAADTLWIPLFMVDNSISGTDGFPETSNNLQRNVSGGAHAALCTKDLNAASFDSGAFTISTSSAWAAFTAAVKPAGGTAHTASQTDNEGLTDTATRVAGYNRSQTDPLGLTDTAARQLAAARSQVDPLGLTDNITVVVGSQRAQTDQVGLSDSVTHVVNHIREIVDQLGATDVVSTAASYVQSIVDVLGLTDAATHGLVFTRSIIDPLGLVDSIAVSHGLALASLSRRQEGHLAITASQGGSRLDLTRQEGNLE